jgi:hypothetical protein
MRRYGALQHFQVYTYVVCLLNRLWAHHASTGQCNGLEELSKGERVEEVPVIMSICWKCYLEADAYRIKEQIRASPSSEGAWQKLRYTGSALLLKAAIAFVAGENRTERQHRNERNASC